MAFDFRTLDETFASLKIRNFRLYFIGIGFSHVGSWMQTVGLGWLVLQLTGSGVALGTLLAIRFAPMLLGGLFAGTLVDRFDKRTLLYITQTAAAFFAFVLTALVFTEVVEMWMVYLTAFGFGVVDALDRPARQTFVHEMVGRENLRNAVALNSALANSARAVGPLIAGVLIASVGISFCFLANAVSFVIYLALLFSLDPKELVPEARDTSLSNVWSGLTYAASVPLLRTVLIGMSFIGTLTYEFQVTLPLFASGTFAGSAADYAALLSAMGAGSVAGGLYAASQKGVSALELVASALLFGISILLTAAMPSIALATVGMVAVGFFSVSMSSIGNTMVQLAADPKMRGRVMSLWSMALFGSTLIGAPIIGAIGQYAGARAALITGAVTALVASVLMGRKLLPRDSLLSIPYFVRIRTEEEEEIVEPKV